jgi:hypothetical protein
VKKPPLAPAVYSKAFSEHVVKNLWEKYPRATESCARMLGLPVKGLAIFFSKDQEMWTSIRYLIKDIQDLQTRLGNNYTDDKFLDRIPIEFRPKRLKRLNDRLDEIRKQTNNKEAGARGGLCEVNTEQRLPSGFFIQEELVGDNSGLC